MDALIRDLKIEKILAEIALKAKLAEGSEGVRAILQTMYRFPKLKNKKIAQITGIAVPALAATRGELVKANIIEDKLNLGEIGKEWVELNLGLKFSKNPINKQLLFSPQKLDIPTDFSYLNTIDNYLTKRPDPEFALDQSRADFKTVLKRTLLLLQKGDIEGRNIIFLGDDDATSLAVGLTQLAKTITVIDIDTRILEYLELSAKELNIKNINFIHHDLREPCPEETLNKFDVVIMDPPYTNEGIRLFLKRARQVLISSIKSENSSDKPNSNLYSIIGKKCLLCFGNKPPEEMQQIQLSILDHGFSIQEMIPEFNHYKGARILGQFSHLYYLNTVRTSDNDMNLIYKDKPLYTREVSHTPNIQRPLGYHFIGEFFGMDHHLLLDNFRIKKFLLEALNDVDLQIIDVYQHNYNPYGYSVVAILQTSHAAIHTWPEHGYASIDIFLCDDIHKGQKAIDILKKKLSPAKAEIMFMERGTDEN